MPNAKIELPDGTHISVDGSIDEIERLMRVYSSQSPKRQDLGKNANPKMRMANRTQVHRSATSSPAIGVEPTLRMTSPIFLACWLFSITTSLFPAQTKSLSGARFDSANAALLLHLCAKIKDCDEAVAIEREVLDSRGLLNRVLLPL